jgi:hypothetical protein
MVPLSFLPSRAMVSTIPSHQIHCLSNPTRCVQVLSHNYAATSDTVLFVYMVELPRPWVLVYITHGRTTCAFLFSARLFTHSVRWHDAIVCPCIYIQSPPRDTHAQKSCCNFDGIQTRWLHRRSPFDPPSPVAASTTEKPSTSLGSSVPGLVWVAVATFTGLALWVHTAALLFCFRIVVHETGREFFLLMLHLMQCMHSSTHVNIPVVHACFSPYLAVCVRMCAHVHASTSRIFCPGRRPSCPCSWSFSLGGFLRA